MHRRLKFCSSNVLKMSKYKKKTTMKQFQRNSLLSVLIFDIMIYLWTELQAPVDCVSANMDNVPFNMDHVPSHVHV